MTIYLHDFNTGYRQVKRMQLQKIANHYKEIADLLSSNEVQAIAKEWNGKTYNKRLSTKLNKISDRFYFDTSLEGVYLYITFYHDRSFKYNNSWYYINGKYDITYISIDTRSKTLVQNLDDLFLDFAKKYQAKYEHLNNSIHRMDDYINRFQKIVQDYNKLYEEMSYSFTNGLGLKLRLAD